MINDILEKLGNNIDGLLYADDAVIWKRGKNFEKKIQVLEQWGVDWGFKFSIKKLLCILHGRKYLEI